MGRQSLCLGRPGMGNNPPHAQPVRSANEPRSQQGPLNPISCPRPLAPGYNQVRNAEANMRQFLVTIICAAALYSQPAGNAPFGGLTADASSRKPAGACKELRGLTSLELSVIGATVIPASASVPEHCRVSLMAQPELNIEVNLPSAWNGRLPLPLLSPHFQAFTRIRPKALRQTTQQLLHRRLQRPVTVQPLANHQPHH